MTDDPRPDNEEELIGEPLDNVDKIDPDYHCNARKWEWEDEDEQKNQLFAGYCNNRAGYKTDHVGAGRCTFHGGSTGAPKNNVNAAKHNLYTERSNYYENLAAVEQAWIDELVRSMLNDAPFGADNFQKFQMLREIAIDMHKKRQANDYTAEEGLIQENIVRDDEGDPVMRDGDLVTEDEENPINIAYDRLDRTMTRKMKELGLLDDPESQKAESGQSIAEQLAQLRKETEEGDNE
jgi:hypothetical protein